MISVEHLTRRFGSITAVDDLTLNVQEELFAFLGPNGAGKTTTIKMMTGLLKPSSGSIQINGIDLLQNPIAAKRSFGLVMEQPFLYEKLTAREFVQFTGRVYRISEKDLQRRMAQLFELFEISQRADDLIENFSHGMKQKVALTGAMLHEPPVLFLDEPLVGLDPRAARSLKDLLRALVSKGTTIFMSTHILEVAERLCDRVGIIHQGRLIALGDLNVLRSTTHDENGTLEDIFLQLTDTSKEESIQNCIRNL